MVNIKTRLEIIFPGITFGAFPGDADCVLNGGDIEWWGRQESQPLEEELNSILQDDIDAAVLNNKRNDMSCTPWQFLDAMDSIGKREQVDSLVANGSQKIKNGYAKTQIWRRLDQFVLQFAPQIWPDDTETELDNFFELAVTL